MVFNISNREDRNLAYQVIVGYIFGYFIIGLFFEGLFKINWKISFMLYLIFTFGDFIIRANYLLRLILYIVENLDL